jgi:hypothetical protein
MCSLVLSTLLVKSTNCRHRLCDQISVSTGAIQLIKPKTMLNSKIWIYSCIFVFRSRFWPALQIAPYTKSSYHQCSHPQNCSREPPAPILIPNPCRSQNSGQDEHNTCNALHDAAFASRTCCRFHTRSLAMRCCFATLRVPQLLA